MKYELQNTYFSITKEVQNSVCVKYFLNFTENIQLEFQDSRFNRIRNSIFCLQLILLILKLK